MLLFGINNQLEKLQKNGLSILNNEKKNLFT